MKKVLIYLILLAFLSCSRDKSTCDFSDAINSGGADYLVSMIKNNRIEYIERRDRLFVFYFEEKLIFICPYSGYRFYYFEQSIIEKLEQVGTNLETIMLITKICSDYHIETVSVTDSNGIWIDLYEKDSYRIQYGYHNKNIPDYVYDKNNSFEFFNDNWIVIKCRRD